jgi:[ribosomal protein S5]-alanine N-acetyltransferase
MFTESLESERLTFKKLSRQYLDVRELYGVFGTPNPDADEVFKYVDFGPHRTIKETRDFVVNAEEQWNEGEGAKYVIRPKSSEENGGEIAGFAGLYPDWERMFATLGIVLDKRFWGRGYSGERAELFVEVVFDSLNLDMVAVKYIDGNTQSKAAVEKYVERFGGQYDGLLRNWIAVGDEVVDCHRYTIRREQYVESQE